MTSRRIIASAVLLTLVTGVQADAAVKKKKPPPKSCNVAPDGSGDATGTGTGTAGPNDPSADIVGADIGSDKTNLTFVWKLSAFESPDPYSPQGHGYDFSFTAPGNNNKFVRAVVSPQGNGPHTPSSAKVTVDTAAKTVYLTVSLSALGLKANQKLTNLVAKSSRWVGMTDVILGLQDTAATNKTYTTAYPTCVPVGK